MESLVNALTAPQVRPPGTADVASGLTLAARPGRQDLPANLVQDDSEPTEWDGTAQSIEPTVPAGGTELGETGGGSRLTAAACETERPHEQDSHAESNPSLIALRNLPRWEVLALALILAGGLVCWSLAAVRIIGLKCLLRDIQPAPADLQERVSAVARQLQLRRLGRLGHAPGIQVLRGGLAGRLGIRCGCPDRRRGRSRGRHQREGTCFLSQKEDENDRSSQDSQGAELGRTTRRARPRRPDLASGPHLGPEA